MPERLTPIDIQNREFPKKMRGYDCDAVDAFMEEVKRTLEELYQENDELRSEQRRLKDKLADYERLEKTLRDTLATAQQISEQIKENAHKEAQAIIAKAELEAEKRLKALETRKAELITQIHELKRERVKFEAKLESLLEVHRRVLEAFREQEEELDKIEETLTFTPKVSKANSELD